MVNGKYYSSRMAWLMNDLKKVSAYTIIKGLYDVNTALMKAWVENVSKIPERNFHADTSVALTEQFRKATTLKELLDAFDRSQEIVKDSKRLYSIDSKREAVFISERFETLFEEIVEKQ